MNSIINQLKRNLPSTTLLDASDDGKLPAIQSSILQLCLSSLSNNGNFNSTAAKASLQKTNDIVTSTTFTEITLSLRKLHEVASICYAIDCVSRDLFELALQVLDRTLMTSGAPCYKSEIHQLIKELEFKLGPVSPLLGCCENIATNSETTSNGIHIYETPPSLHEFQRNNLDKSIPCLIRGALEHWPALDSMSDKKWTVDKIREVIGRRLVPVEIGAKYTDDEWGQKVISGKEFMDCYVLQIQQQPLDEEEEDTDSNDEEQNELESHVYTSKEPNLNFRKRSRSHSPHDLNPAKRLPSHPKIGYLAQHDLFSQIPALYNDIAVPEYCYLPYSAQTLESEKISTWLGPGGTVSPLHTDPHMNIFTQVMGKKYIRLYSPQETPRLYPHEDGMLQNTSQVDVEDPDLKRFPQFGAAVYQDCVVGPGDMLFIPKGWWHFVKSESISFSVSFWF